MKAHQKDDTFLSKVIVDLNHLQEYWYTLKFLQRNVGGDMEPIDDDKLLFDLWTFVGWWKQFAWKLNFVVGDE